MRQVVYALQFRGQAAPVEGQEGILAATTSSPSAAITTTIGGSGLSTTIAPVAGSDARFESRVTMTGEQAFKEEGTITFGEGNRLRFSTLGEGYLGPCAGPKLSAGAVMWKLDDGES